MVPRDVDHAGDGSLERLRRASDAAARAFQLVLRSGRRERRPVWICPVVPLPDPAAFPRLVEIARN
jgi:hypothetical protein